MLADQGSRSRERERGSATPTAHTQTQRERQGAQEIQGKLKTQGTMLGHDRGCDTKQAKMAVLTKVYFSIRKILRL